MPLFDFRCQSCAHEFEALVRAASYNDPPTTCPSCGSAWLDRLLSTFAVSSSEQTKAFAAAKNKKAATAARQQTAAEHRDEEAHRHEEH